MNWHDLTRSLRGKLMLVTLATTFIALLASALALVLVDIRSYRQSMISDLVTQATILGRSNVPALTFDDPRAARENLALLSVRGDIYVAALYTADGRLFARYMQPSVAPSTLPAHPAADGYRVEDEEIDLFQTIKENGERIGSIYLRAHYELPARLRNHLMIVAAVMAGGLLLALAVSSRLQATVIQPILAVTQTARRVMENRDFSLRVPQASNDEIGYLVSAFNDMLAELGKRSEALEQSNRNLQHEMQERLGAEEALKTADRRKDEFLATLAHELRNPLAPLTTGLQILRRAGPDAHASERAYAMMDRQLRQMVRLVDDLIDVSRITTGKLTVKREPVLLQRIVQDATETVDAFLRTRGHTLSVELPATPVWLDADATRLTQVFANLLHNAAKYSGPGTGAAATAEASEISLRAALEDGSVVVRVRDRGQGIAPDMLARVFDLFTQADQSLERSQAGLGVGLSLAKRLVELHGGSIQAHSAGPGRGSEFEVRLPTGAAPDQPAAAAPSAAELAGTNCRVLLAEDNVDFAVSFAMLLRSMGNTVQVTHDGAAALVAASSFHPDVAFLDIGLPKLNGYDLARRLRQLPVMSDCTLVAVTGWGQDKDRQLAREAGFDHHLLKPLDFDAVERIVQDVCRRRSAATSGLPV
jgi:signal transduction histidine kinase/ActR/RegA family two-component response regulator